MAKVHLISCGATILLAGCAHLNGAVCRHSPKAEADIDRTVHGFFDALRKEDKVAFRRVTTSSFYSFDGGKRYVGTELLDLVRDVHARGIQLNWSVGPLNTRRRCDVASSAWENVGNAGIPPDVKPVRWLESAVLVREDGGWKIDFFHSQRATAQ